MVLCRIGAIAERQYRELERGQNPGGSEEGGWGIGFGLGVV